MDTSTQRLPKLRELLSHPPDARIWNELLELLLTWDWDDDLSLESEYLQQHLKHWPTQLRVFNKEKEPWPEQLMRDPNHPLMRVFAFASPRIHHFPYWGDERLPEALKEFRQDLELLAMLPALHTIEIPSYPNADFGCSLQEILFPSLHRLLIKDSQLSPTALCELLQIPPKELTRLEIGCPQRPPVLQDDLSALAQLGTYELPHLRVFHLFGYLLGTEIATFLQQCTWSELQELNLSHNAIEAQALLPLQQSPFLPHLEHLDLSHNRLGPQGAALLSRLPMPCLRTLSLAFNKLGDDGIDTLLTWPAFAQLEQLDLEGNDLTNDTAQKLAQRLPYSALQHLALSWNDITQQGAELLRQHAPSQLDLKPPRTSYPLGQFPHRHSPRLLLQGHTADPAPQEPFTLPQESTNWRFQQAAETHTGHTRQHNEDGFFSLPQHGIFQVTDGMGGQASGSLATQFIHDFIQRSLNSPTPPHNEQQGEEVWPYHNRTKTYLSRCIETLPAYPSQLPHVALLQLLHEASRCLYQGGRTDGHDTGLHHGLGVTFAGLCFWRQSVLTFHVGDARVYRWRHQQLLPLTTDHSLLQEILRQKLIAPEEAHKFPHRNIITRCLGIQKDTPITLSLSHAQHGDLYLLCTNGLTDELSPLTEQCTEDTSRLSSLLQDAQHKQQDLPQIAQHLMQHALQGEAKDNITLMLVRPHTTEDPHS